MVQRTSKNLRALKINSKLLTIFLVLIILTAFLLFQNLEHRLCKLSKISHLVNNPDLKLESEASENSKQYFDFQVKKENNLTSVNNNISAVVLKTQLHVLLVAGWRTGSSFTGDILKSHRLAFYHYEPLLFYQQNLTFDASIAIDHLKRLFQCNYDKMSYYLDYSTKKSWMWAFNRQLWPFCKPFPLLCQNAKFLSSICQIFPVRIIKTVRLSLSAAQALLEDYQLNLKVIYLVRDPRGIYNSRLKQKWCKQGQDCIDLEKMCTRMVDDFMAAKKIKDRYSDKIMVLRYEDLINEPLPFSVGLFKFLNISLTSEVSEFLKRNTLSQVFRSYKSSPFIIL